MHKLKGHQPKVSMPDEHATTSAHASVARGALERVCSGACLHDIAKYYSPNFLDHVNGAHLSGFAGIEKSVARYRTLLSDLTITVQDQLTEGDRVMCRFVVAGKVSGHPVSIDGMTVSRFENGLIVEDWSVTDTLSMVRQVGLWRCLWLLIRNRQ